MIFYASFGDYRIAVEVPEGWNNGQIQQELIAGFTRATGMVLGESYAKCFQVEPMFDSHPMQLGYTLEAQGTWRKHIPVESPNYWSL